MKASKYIDHTVLKPETTKAQILTLCQEAKEHDFASVCVNPTGFLYVQMNYKEQM